ncbi:hypothetical protein SUDANB51_06763 [Streptomyces sp. enrichment culture]
MVHHGPMSELTRITCSVTHMAHIPDDRFLTEVEAFAVVAR